MKVYRDRKCIYTTRKKIRYVSLFKNSGKKAGASINHLHSQLIALPFCPLFWQVNWRLSGKKRDALTVLSLIWKRHLSV